MKTAKRILVWIILLIFTGMSAALAMKAAVGVSAWDAMSQSISMTTGIKIGTVAIGTNTLCVLLQLLLLRKNFRVRELLQIPLTIASGSVINFFYYDVFSAIAIKQYILKFIPFAVLKAQIEMKTVREPCLMCDTIDMKGRQLQSTVGGVADCLLGLKPAY